MRSLSDLRADEPEFEVAAHALLRSAGGDPPLSRASGEVLRTIGDRREEEAHQVFINNLALALPPGAVGDPERLLYLYEGANSDREQRRAACLLLGESDPPGAQGALLDAFSGSDSDLAFDAANALFSIRVRAGHPLTDALQPLTTALQSTNDPAMRHAAIYALGRVCGSGATEVLIQVLDEPGAATEIRVAALQGLAFVGPSERVRRRITEALADADPAVRVAGVGSVVRNWPGVSEALRGMTEDFAVVSGFGTVAENVMKKLYGTY